MRNGVNQIALISVLIVYDQNTSDDINFSSKIGRRPIYCGRLDRRPQRCCRSLTVCPISGASGSDAESYNCTIVTESDTQLQSVVVSSKSKKTVVTPIHHLLVFRCLTRYIK